MHLDRLVVSPPSPSFSALPSLDRLQLSALKVLTTRGARRTAWTWRCLGSYARRHDKHESLLQTDRALWSRSGITCNFWFPNHFFPHPCVFSVRFTPRFFPLHNISATDLNDLSFLLFPLEEQKRCKPLGGETNSVEQYLFTEYRQRGWFRRPAQFRTKVGAKRTNGTRMRHPNPRRRTPASKKAR